MPALEAGAKAPSIHLPLVGGMQFSLQQALQEGPAVIAFFKVSCPVCQFSFPYLERLYQASKGKKVTFVGVSQNSHRDTEAFMNEFGVTFPVALENPEGYTTSNAYGLTNVPTIFYVDQDGTIEISSVGWSRADVEQIARRISELGKSAPISIIRPGENVPAFSAG
jgi:peroxiredoxin